MTPPDRDLLREGGGPEEVLGESGDDGDDRPVRVRTGTVQRASCRSMAAGAIPPLSDRFAMQKWAS